MENYIDGSRKFRPCGDNVVVLLDSAKDEAARDMLSAGSLLVMPDTTTRRPIDAAWGTIVAVPENLRSYRRHCNKCHRPHDEYADKLEVGMRVAVDSALAGDALLIDGVEHRIVKVAEIHLGVEG